MATTTRMATLPGTTDRRIDALLALLAENSTIVISGAKIAKEIGVSRQQVWRWIEKLRALGVRVKGHAAHRLSHRARAGYSGAATAEPPPHGTAFAKRIYHFFKIDSTNTVAMHLGEAGEPHGAVVLAEEQTAGRGRAGRNMALGEIRWHLLQGSAFVRAFLPRTPRCSRWSPASPRATLRRGARRALPISAGRTILLVGGRKFCGILTEMHAEPDRVHYAVIGIGINVNQTKMPAELADIATSLRIETGKSHSRLELLIRLLRHLDRYYNQFLAEGAAPILRRFAEVSSYFQGQARADHHGDRKLHGHHGGARTKRRAARGARRWPRHRSR